MMVMPKTRNVEILYVTMPQMFMTTLKQPQKQTAMTAWTMTATEQKIALIQIVPGKPAREMLSAANLLQTVRKMTASLKAAAAMYALTQTEMHAMQQNALLANIAMPQEAAARRLMKAKMFA